MHISRTIKIFLALISVTLPLVLSGVGQEPAETSTKSTPFTLKVQRNEVPVRVVVRDRNGRPARNLTKDDFQLFDNGKPQVITQFSIERTAAAGGSNPDKAVSAIPGVQASSPQVADRFMAFYFDDLVMNFEAVARTRAAASKYLQTSLHKTDRVALFTSSGQVTQDFTSDREKIDAALQRLRPIGIFRNTGHDCPELSAYEAYLIVDQNNQQALEIAKLKTVKCLCADDPRACPELEAYARRAAQSRWTQAEMQQSYSLRGLDALVRRLSVLPGQRGVIFVSPGFLTGLTKDLTSMVIDRAVRAGVFVSSLDSRGLYTLIPAGDASQPGPGFGGSFAAILVQFEMAAAHADSGVLEEIADGTGGVFFENSNDFDAGFRSAGNLTEFSYVLVFSPSDLKPDGKFHKLQVKLVGDAAKKNLTVQARRGYFASIQKKSPAEAELEELTSAVFNRAEVNTGRLRIGTQFFKPTPLEAQLKIVAHLDLKDLAFRDEADRHAADITFVTGIFDANGNFVQGLRKDVKLRLRNETLESMRAGGISVSSNFKVPPGTYLVREVARDESGEISSVNGTVEIPY